MNSVSSEQPYPLRAQRAPCFSHPVDPQRTGNWLDVCPPRRSAALDCAHGVSRHTDRANLSCEAAETQGGGDGAGFGSGRWRKGLMCHDDHKNKRLVQVRSRESSTLNDDR